MEITKEDINLENGLKKEWLITNGMGGYASSTIIGANTRKYHGLLIAPLKPPAQRYLVLSKLDESVEIEGKKYELFTNVCENYISQGYKYQEKFKKEEFPTFIYKVEGIEIEKTICMKQGKEMVGVYYKIKNTSKPSKLTLAPVINLRDFHSMSIDSDFNIEQQIEKTTIKIIVNGKSEYPVFMKISEGKYVKHENDIFKNMFYLEEQKRGFYPKENHDVTGVFEIELRPNEEKEISFICGLDENLENINLKNIIEEENVRQQKLTENIEINNKQNEKLVKELVKAADQFIVYRPECGLHTVIAGYPWFLDWGRDTLIAFEGLLLKTNKFELAKEVLLTMIKDIKCGLVPNGYSELDNTPLYNSVDASLLLFEQVQKYINYTGDYQFIKDNIYNKLKEIIENYINGIDIDDNNIYLDSDYLLVSGTENTQNTWMDAKTYGIAATPRNGKAVEINSLWYNSLMVMTDLVQYMGETEKSQEYKKLARRCKKTFNEKFYNVKRKCLYDVIGDNKIRPNQLFALSLTFPVIDANTDIAYNIVNVVEKKLLNNYGLKTLAKGEKNYVDIYEGDSFKRDMSYHQGITWTWLLGLYFDSLKNMIKVEKRKTYKLQLENKLERFIEKTAKTFEKEIDERGCIGSISEIYDSVKPFSPKGATAQAWSVAEILRILFEGTKKVKK